MHGTGELSRVGVGWVPVAAGSSRCWRLRGGENSRLGSDSGESNELSEEDPILSDTEGDEVGHGQGATGQEVLLVEIDVEQGSRPALEPGYVQEEQVADLEANRVRPESEGPRQLGERMQLLPLATPGQTP